MLDTTLAPPDLLALLAEENSALVENSLDMLSLLDADARFLRVNAAARAILGYEPGELAGRRYTDFVHPEDLERALHIETRLRHGEPELRDVRLRFLRKDGAVILMSTAVRRCVRRGRMYASSRDVSAQQQIKDGLLQSEARLNAMLDSIGDAFFAVDGQWRISYANSKAAYFVGVTVEAAIGRSLLEIAPDLEHSQALVHYREAMATRQARSFEVYWEPHAIWLEVRVYPSEGGLSVYFHDINEKRMAEAAVRKSEQRFRSLFQQAGDSIMIVDQSLRIVAVNGRACELFGYSEQEFLALRVPDIKLDSPRDAQALGAMRAGQPVLLRARKKRRDGSSFPAEVQISRIEDDGEELFLAIIRDLSDREESERRLRELATHDTLTGLPNRVLLGERMQDMLERCPPGESVAVMFLDLDRFKEVNDSFGHEMGDELLCEVATRLRDALRPEDVIARLGGDEFVVAAACAGGAGAAARIADKLLAVLAAPVAVGGHDVIVGASIGISLYPQDAGTRETLFQTADTAMYRAKSSGRNRYRFFEPEMTVATRERMALEVSLRPALPRREFELHYQPRVDLASMRPVGMEALIRWNHPERGRVSPQQFIGIAEETGLICEIGHWVLQEACTATRRLMDEFGRELRVSVNVSARQLARPRFGDEVREVLAASGLPPHCLELELTESALIEDIEQTAGILRELKKLGLALAVDDFGTGYSALAYLRRFPIDVLKLDRSFVLEQDDAIDSFDFVKAFVGMAHALKLAVVAEGVETAEVLAFLRAAQCDEAQGYYLARPMPLEALRERLGAWPASPSIG
ncbi:hypothetical protein B0920_05510 [Massilia sp. KIM]|uniref:sensor domain-containing protein n=1 Tax=Massilia sp. KIM TaxID=1955422 RepID=UPI00098FC372|nr:bifunctional diguanylate cyclase/phosphodiesterase [Massilia sp. KIM]OON62888.1 hypothetical protein B0920_05510 [Massilia sp. KIM]